MITRMIDKSTNMHEDNVCKIQKNYEKYWHSCISISHQCENIEIPDNINTNSHRYESKKDAVMWHTIYNTIKKSKIIF